MKAIYRIKDGDGRNIKPNFFKPVSKDKGYYNPEKNSYAKHKTSMDYVQTVLNKFRQPYESNDYTPFSELFFRDAKVSSKTKGQVQRILSLVRQSKDRISGIWGTTENRSMSERYMLVERERQEFLEYISKIDISDSIARELLRAVELPINKDIGRFLFYTLFSLPHRDFLGLINASRQPVAHLVKDAKGDIDLFDEKYSTHWV